VSVLVIVAAVAVLAAAACGAGWLRSRRAYKRDVRILVRTLADLAPKREDLRPVLRAIDGGRK
jgi:hypothetical protein